MELNSTIKVSKKDTEDKEFATYTLKISQPLFKKFKIRSLKDNHATYRETLTRLIEEYVNR
tara:strand:+ start:461 stop:643 length:183 start_codon:yes stop_codon:yes gene_type:complete